MTDIQLNLRALDAAYKPFPPFAEWARKTSVDVVRWNRYVASLRDRSRQSPAVLERALQVATRAAAIDTGALENLYEADRGFTYTVAFQTSAWEAQMDARGEQVRPLFEAQLHGYEFVLTLATGAEPISEAAIRELHVQMCAAQPTYRVMTAVGPQEQPLPKGQYKSLPNHVRTRIGESHSYAPVDVTPEEMYRLVEELRGDVFLAAHPVVQAAYAHYCLVVIHPFADGNGRVARALASAFTYRAISMPILILAEEKPSYLDALESADAGNFQDFCRFMEFRAIDTIDLIIEALGLASVPVPEISLKELRSLPDQNNPVLPTFEAMGESLLRMIRDAIESEKRTLDLGADVKINVDITKEDEYEGEKTVLTIYLSTTKIPASTSIGSSIEFMPWEIPEGSDEIALQLTNGIARFSAQDLFPVASSAVRLRISILAKRLVAEMLDSLRSYAEAVARDSN